MRESIEDIIRKRTDDWLREAIKKVESGDFSLLDNPRPFAMADILVSRESTDATILDVGVAFGDLLFLLKQRGFKNLSGMDFSEEALKFVRKRLCDSLPLYQMDVSMPEYPKGADRYDVIILGDIIEHIWAPKRALLNMRPLLEDGGRLLVSVPNAGFIMNGLLMSFFPEKLFLSNLYGSWTDHINAYNQHLLKSHLIACGFKPLMITGSGAKIFFPRPKGMQKKLTRKFLLSMFWLCELLRPLSNRLFSQNIIILAQKVGEDNLDVDVYADT